MLSTLNDEMFSVHFATPLPAVIHAAPMPLYSAFLKPRVENVLFVGKLYDVHFLLLNLSMMYLKNDYFFDRISFRF